MQITSLHPAFHISHTLHRRVQLRTYGHSTKMRALTSTSMGRTIWLFISLAIATVPTTHTHTHTTLHTHTHTSSHPSHIPSKTRHPKPTPAIPTCDAVFKCGNPIVCPPEDPVICIDTDHKCKLLGTCLFAVVCPNDTGDGTIAYPCGGDTVIEICVDKSVKCKTLDGYVP